MMLFPVRMRTTTTLSGLLTLTTTSCSTSFAYNFLNLFCNSSSSVVSAKRATSSIVPLVTSRSTCSSAHTNKMTSKSATTSSEDLVDSISGYLSSSDASALDMELMSQPGGFALEQLMELAGLSVAEAVFESYPPSHTTHTNTNPHKKVVVVCGPGNNGGDGLVAARHLVHFGYECVVVYPKPSKNNHFINLVQQCKDMNIPIVEAFPKDYADIIVDAIFGFSFQGEPREPYASIIYTHFVHSTVPVISVDVPSGWDVDNGDILGIGFMPDVLVSLTTPKFSSKKFTGRHFIGGRFLPPKLAIKYGIKMPPYNGVSQVFEFQKPSEK